jgi:hypothetical protein
MSDINNGAEQMLEIEPPQPQVFSGVESNSRRRWIKLGTAGVPIVATITSQPVMAWHCYSASAWGSAQMVSNVGSAKTRRDATQVDGTECWSISNWVNNILYAPANATYKPWKVLAMARYASPNNTIAYAQANCKVSDIFPGGLSGVAGTVTVYNVVIGSNTFARAITVARLNSLYASAKALILKCVVPTSGAATGIDQILEMAKLGGNYKAPNSTTKSWTTADIEAYLNASYLAVP